MNDRGARVVGLLGCGVVGGGVADRIFHALPPKAGHVEIGQVLVRDLSKPRFPPRVHRHLTNAAERVLNDPALDVVVECLGGVEPAATYVESALRRGVHVVTANKAMVAEHGARYGSLALEFGATFSYEAAVGGAVPAVRIVRMLAATDEIVEIAAVVNGTTNYVLSAMEDGASFDEAVAGAQREGFAESDPSTDIDGIDTTHKLSILVAEAFGTWPRWQSIPRRGIRDIVPDDITYARRRNARIKLVASARRQAGVIVASVGPTLVPLDHALAAPKRAENAVVVVAKHAGPITIGGLGAGREPTAAAIIEDLVDVLSARSNSVPSSAPFSQPLDEEETKYA